MSAGSASSQAAAPPAAEIRSKQPGRIRRAAVAAWKTFLAMLFCQTLVGGVAAVGWTYRLMRRQAVRYWWKRRPDSFSACRK